MPRPPQEKGLQLSGHSFNWRGVVTRLLFAVLATLALFGWLIFGWGEFLGVCVGFLVAMFIVVVKEARLDDPAFDPFAWRVKE